MYTVYYIIISLKIEKYYDISHTSMNSYCSQVNKPQYCNNINNIYIVTKRLFLLSYTVFFCIGCQVLLLLNIKYLC